MPLQRRVPKRGSNNIFADKIVAVNLSTLDRKFNNGDEVTVETLAKAGVVKNSFDAVKILGNGKLTKKLTVKLPLIASKTVVKGENKEEVKVLPYSKSAKAAIEAAGGKAEVI